MDCERGRVHASLSRGSKANNALMCRILSRLWREDDGQDLIEYALMTATLAVVVAGFLPTTVMPAVSSIFSKISSTIAIS